MSIEEFKRWLRKFDADKDGKISRKELEDAIAGGWFTRWKGKPGIRSADSNGNGFIDESEIDNLVEFAQKYLGVKILQF
jgi:Ca2+-binding EF-hand superfamily protein